MSEEAAIPTGERPAEDIARSMRMAELARVDDLDGMIAIGAEFDWTNPGNALDLYCVATAAFRRSGQAEFFTAAFRLLDLIAKREADVVAGMPPSLLVYIILQLIHLVEMRSSRGPVRLMGRDYAFLHAAARQASRLTESFPEAAGLREAVTRLLKRFWAVALDGQDTPSVYYLRPNSPAVLQIEPTNACNLKCTMCPRTLAMSRPVRHMPVELYEQVLEGWSGRCRTGQFRHAAYGVNWTISTHGQVKLFYLGEIFEHPQFEEIIRTTVRHGATPLVQTNGVHLIKRSVRRRLLEAAPPTLGISLDGISEETYNAVRSGSNWQGIVQAIRALRDERKALGLESAVRLHVTTILPGEAPELRAKVTEFLKPVAECVDEVMYIGLGRAHNPEFFDGGGQVQEMRPASDLSWPEVLARLPSDQASCVEPLNKLNVLSDGRVTPCCPDVNGDLALGTATEGIDAIWNSDALQRLQRAHLSHALDDYALCQSCISSGQTSDDA